MMLQFPLVYSLQSVSSWRLRFWANFSCRLTNFRIQFKFMQQHFHVKHPSVSLLIDKNQGQLPNKTESMHVCVFGVIVFARASS